VKCKILVNKGNVFAYVEHYKTRNEIKIWCRGDPAKLREMLGREFEERGNTAGDWESSYTGFFKVTDPNQIPKAVRVLFECAYVERVESSLDLL
jgi:hypothetical protein